MDEQAIPAAGELARRGFLDTRRAVRFLGSPVFASLDPGELVASLSTTAEPDVALLALLRLGEEGVDLGALRHEDPERWRRLTRVTGASRWAGDQLVSRPDLIGALREPAIDEPYWLVYERVAALMEPFLHDGGDLEGGTEALRRNYRRELLGILSADLELSEPSTVAAREAMPRVAAAISRLVGASLDGALRLAQALNPAAHGIPFAVVAMGKTGGEELNYISDVDVVYVCEGPDEAAVVAATIPVATTILHIVSGAVGSEPPLWPLDANLRPEGKDGPLVRTLGSHLTYYKRWAKGWEFQALLKSRPVAGDSPLGDRYVAGTQPLVWRAVERENFVEDAQAMRRRVEDHVRANGVDRQLKLGRGGLRDVEFTVQLLQLVHGRTDESLRSRTTLTALDALAAAGYVGRDHASELTECYEFLRALEHRIQFDRMRRSHVVPRRTEELRRLSRLLGVADVEKEWTATRRRVRALHEAIFYRPILPLTARLSAGETSLEPEAATARLKAIGYRDPAGAMRHISALTEGITRRAAIQRQLLPVMLGWFAAGPDPDAGLLEFRKLSETMGRTHWYLKLLRDSGAAAERLALILASSSYCAEALRRLPESVQWLAQDEQLKAQDPDALRAELAAVLSRHESHEERVTAVRYLRRRELTRASLSDVLRHVEPERCVAMTDAADIAVAGALAIAEQEVRARRGLGVDPGARFAAIAMGRMGGREMNYSSDADLMFVYEAVGSGERDRQEALEYATEIAGTLREILTEANPEPPLPVDVDLRPEGRNGPVVRSLGSYGEYYARWSEPWEWQALLRARPVAGDAELMGRFAEMIDAVRYRPDGLDAAALTRLRRIKARVESERMPRGVAPHRHLKLGRGALTDVEFAAQFLQLRHAGEFPQLRTTSTVEAISGARAVGLVSAEDAEDLLRAWRLASRIRDAIMLVTNRAARSDLVPKPGRELSVVSRILGYAPGTSLEFEEDWLRAARRARRVVERVFYE
ncbi:MAG TPA: bifunctional [glutamine synthetase] adenylyltransferase/[glutamine synthetase]-adenylyl-L-tyrosine phosphorylase [Actinomycetaceae bacterium]|nr:bifunctional [glutamine synthetase] adenylyltransferase/[glutamine synthetase]-adenylyl-L-tyrosine phosphorylase [Actinomycetaceae bacterium]